MTEEGVPLPRFHLRPDEEILIGVDADPSGDHWNLRIELFLRVNDHTVHRYGPIWLDPSAVEDATPRSLEQLIRQTLVSAGYEVESCELGAGE
jgi:hypothetical protein